MYEQSPSRYVMLKRQRKRKRARRLKRFCLISFLILLLIAAVFAIVRITDIVHAKKQLKTIRDIQVPQYVDVQLLEVGNARTAVKLSAIKNIVVHYVGNPGTSAQNNHDYFAKEDTTVCSHFLVGLDGEIIQCLPLDEKSAASNWRNKDTISIEVCHPDEDGKFNDTTYSSLVKLTAWLCKTFGLSQNEVIRHYDITGKLCPLYYVNHQDEWKLFKDDVKNLLIME